VRAVPPARALFLTRRRALLAFAAVAAALVAWLVFLWVRLPDPAPFARKNPRSTALIEQRRAEAGEARRRFAPRQSWVALDRISPRLVQAVILSEDAKFFGHEGFDWGAIQDAAEAGWEKGHFTRGASTITQQLAKNLWLGTERTFSRKAKEALLAVKLERTLPKKRILALYLNVVEWRDGVFGAEAASRAWFGKPARDLSTAEAALLASMLPAPRKAALAPAPRWLARRARRCVDRLYQARKIDLAEHARARAELEALLSGDRGGGDDPPEDGEPTVAGPAVDPSLPAMRAAVAGVTASEQVAAPAGPPATASGR
jgi:monofunctional biosynthetic peptidoglycan transglycosylase